MKSIKAEIVFLVLAVIIGLFTNITPVRGYEKNKTAYSPLYPPPYPPPSSILYVKSNASGLNNGSTWADAYTDLQSALAAASSGDEIWVAAGTYKPTLGTDPTISFTLKNGVAIYGGFAGTETLRIQRSPSTNVTILSGDIGVLNNIDDNSYHVVVGSGTNNTALLDGFTVTAGNSLPNVSLSGFGTWGGGMYNEGGSPSLTNVIFSDNYAYRGGGMLNLNNSNPTLNNVTFLRNSANSISGASYPWGGGMANFYSNPILTNVNFVYNTSQIYGGGMANYHSNPPLTNVTFLENSGISGGGLYNSNSSPTLENITFSGNMGIEGGGLYNQTNSSPIIINSTFSGNTANEGGGISNVDNSHPTITNATFSGNIVNSSGSAILDWNSSSTLKNVILWGDQAPSGSEIYTNSSTTVSYSIVQGGYAGTGNLSTDPKLGSLANNGGFTQTMALGADSPAIDAGGDANCPATDQRGITRPQDLHCDIGAYEAKGPIEISIGGTVVNTYALGSHESKRVNFIGVNSGPIEISATNAMNLIEAERAIYKVGGVNTSYSELMALPSSQLTTTYWLPWYNNVDLDTQLRIGNVSGTPAQVHVFIAGQEVNGSPFNLSATGAGQSLRLSFPNVNSGPVQIVADQTIVAAERVIYKVNGTNTSFSELMALPDSQLTTTYWLPWYNNIDLDTQLRIGNVSGTPAQVHVFIAGNEVNGSPFNLSATGAGQSLRLSFPNVNSGPVQIVSNQNIVAAERVIYKVNGTNTSFSELMALPNSQLTTTYWLPWYNNVDLDTQLRIGNVSGTPAQVHVFIAGNEVNGSPFNLSANGTGQSLRLSFPNVNSGPVQIVSNQNIVAAERVIYKVNGTNTSFSELMALPDSGLDTTFWLPWYNNVDLDTQLRFGAP